MNTDNNNNNNKTMNTITSIPDQPKENPVPLPKPALRLSIHKVKNGWTMDVNYEALRQFGDCYSTPGYVYTKATLLASDILGFLTNGKPAESDFVGAHLSSCYSYENSAPPVPTTIDSVKQEAFLEGVKAGRAEREDEVTGWRKSSDRNNDVVQRLRETVERLTTDCSLLTQVNVALVQERDAAREAALWPKVRTLEHALDTVLKERDEATTLSNSLRFQRDVAINEGNKALKERDEAYAKVAFLEKAGQERWERGYKSGMSRVMAEVKRISANICANIGGGAK